MVKTEVYLMDARSLKEEAVFSSHLGQVSRERQVKIKMLKSRDAKALSLAAGLLLKEVLKSRQINREALIIYNKNGKPFLKDYPGFHFNLSHSGDFVVCATGPQAIGIDIQKIKDLNLTLAQRFFHPNEFEFLMALPSEMRKTAFSQIWAAKESYLKYLGTGLATRLDSFAVHLDQEGGQIKGVKAHLKKYQGPEDYVIYCCRKDDHFDGRLKTIAVKGGE